MEQGAATDGLLVVGKIEPFDGRALLASALTTDKGVAPEQLSPGKSRKVWLVSPSPLSSLSAYAKEETNA